MQNKTKSSIAAEDETIMYSGIMSITIMVSHTIFFIRYMPFVIKNRIFAKKTIDRLCSIKMLCSEGRLSTVVPRIFVQKLLNLEKAVPEISQIRFDLPQIVQTAQKAPHWQK